MHLFVVDTPLQLLNVIEARAAFPVDSCTVVILMWPHWSRQPFELILRDNTLDDVRFFTMRERAVRKPAHGLSGRITDRLREYRTELMQLAFRKKFDSYMGRFTDVDQLFVGNYRNDYMKHVANIVPHRRLILLDDGTDTLHAAQERQAHTVRGDQPPTGLIRRLKDHYLRKRIDWDCRQAPAVTFFSSYEIECSGADNHVRNRYARLQARLRTSESSDEVYFLGQPLVADGYLDKQTYTSYLAGIRKHFADRELYYIPHPRELEQDYAELARQLDFEVLGFNVPIEVALCSADRTPAVIASLFCSALENLSFLFPDRVAIVAFEISSDDLLGGHELVAGSYRHFRKNRRNSISVIPLTQASGSMAADRPA